MFYECNSLKFINLSNVNGSLLNSMDSIIYGCNSLEYVDLSYFDASSVSSLFYIFSGYDSLKSINLSNFDASSVNYMKSMFSGCSSLETIDLSSFNTLYVLNMANMFSECKSLKSIDLSNFVTPYLTDMSSMFSGCNSLRLINLTNFDTTLVTDMNSMFLGCDSLKFLIIPDFNMINCGSYDNMFSNINNIRFINLSDSSNDKILSTYFTEINNDIYVCQKDNIISNPKLNICSNYNFTIDKCDLNADSIYPDKTNNPGTSNEIENPDTIRYTEKTDKDTSDSSSDNYIQSKSNNSSTKISIGVIIGLIVGIVVLITIITIIICYCKNKMSSSSPNNYTDTSNTKINLPEDQITEYEPQTKNDVQKVRIQLITTCQFKIEIIIDPNKTFHELIKFYFDKINRSDLFGDERINFLFKAKNIPHDSKDLIKDYINKEFEVNTIIVNDVDD